MRPAIGVLLLCLAAFHAGAGTAAAAAVHVVDSAGDEPDANLADGDCATASGACTLRAAIGQANANAGHDEIRFAIGSGPATIVAGSPLPFLTGPVTIDGTTQPGYDGTPLVRLEADPVNGALTLGSSGSAVAALDLPRGGLNLTGGGGHHVENSRIGFESPEWMRGIYANSDDNVIGPGNVISGTFLGIVLAGSRNLVRGNLIGTDPAGTSAVPNDEGVAVWLGTGNVIGGAAPGDANVISGNATGVRIEYEAEPGNLVAGNLIGTDATGSRALGNGDGVRIDREGQTVAGNTVSGNRDSGVVTYRVEGVPVTDEPVIVRGNRIGTDATGTTAVPNGAYGVALGELEAVVGGTDAGEGNVISGNGRSGIYSYAGHVIQGNVIGTDATGTRPIPNGEHGIETVRDGVLVGGSGPGEGNRIAYNAGHGVASFVGRGITTILGNSIDANGGLGIALTAGPVPNDLGDGDEGANGLQNHPDVVAATAVTGTTTVLGLLSSAASTTYRVEFFGVASCDPSGFGEGDRFLGSTDVTTGPFGLAPFVATGLEAAGPGWSVTATATAPDGSTSGFSGCVAVLPV